MSAGLDSEAVEVRQGPLGGARQRHVIEHGERRAGGRERGTEGAAVEGGEPAADAVAGGGRGEADHGSESSGDRSSSPPRPEPSRAAPAQVERKLGCPHRAQPSPGSRKQPDFIDNSTASLRRDDGPLMTLMKPRPGAGWYNFLPRVGRAQRVGNLGIELPLAVSRSLRS